MSSIVDAAKQLGDQIVKRKQKKINTFVSMLEDPDLPSVG